MTVVADFERWLLGSDRLDTTIALRVRHARALLEVVDLASVTLDDLEEVRARMRRLAPETRKSTLASWRVLFRWAVLAGIRYDDPSLGLDSVRVRPRMPRVAGDDAVRFALRTASPHDRAMIVLARFACLRLTELTQLSTFDRDGDRLRIRGKGDRERVVYANDAVVAALDALELLQGEGYYFPGMTGEHLHPMSVNKIITRVTGCNPHSLRHAGATAAYRATRDLRGVQEMLGHASLATTQRYLHLDDDARRVVAAATAFGSSLAA